MSSPKVKWCLVDISESPTKKMGAWGAKPQSTTKQTVVRYTGSNKISESMTDWFFTEHEDEVSPYIFTRTFAENFLKELQKTDFEAIYSPSVFTKKMYAAVTAHVYFDYYEQKQAGVPSNLQKVPKGWTNQTQAIWYDFVHTRYLDDHFFDRFWHNLSLSNWEESYPYIRNYLQSILPYYIKYDNNLLVDHALIAVNSEGEYVDPLEADIEDYDDNYD